MLTTLIESSTVSPSVSATGQSFINVYDLSTDSLMLDLEDTGIFSGKHAIRTKWVYRNKKDERGIVVRNKVRLVPRGYTQEEGIDYDGVFAPVARIKAIRLFLAYASFMGFIVYQMDVKSAFLYGTIEEEVMQRDDGIFISQDKYMADILKEVLILSMIGSLMYLTASRPDIMFAVCACVRYLEAENDLTIEEKTELITELINYQKDFARIKKYQAQQQRLASKSERRKFYTSVLRSHAGWKTKDLRGMTFDQLEEKFIPVWESIQDFVPMDSKKESESLKRSGILLEKVKAKRLKTSDVSAQEQQESDNQDEIINLQQWAVLVREETSVNITPSVVKVPICDWKIYKDKLREVYQIFRVGQAPKVYPYFESMLKDFDRDDLVTLWKLVKDRFKTELPKSDLEKCLFWPLKVMFEPVATDLLWQFEAPIKSWKMYKSCKVHCLSMEGMIIYMLDDVEYPFQKTTLKKMLDHKCEVSEFNEDVIQMINLIRGQLKKE
ncbi:uncharacterized mitochondrial protein-like protein [Tanacetum coccineum]